MNPVTEDLPNERPLVAALSQIPECLPDKPEPLPELPGKRVKKKQKTKKKEAQAEQPASLSSLIMGFVDRIFKDHVMAYASEAAYFVVLSFIPFVTFLTSLIRYTDLSYNILSETIRNVVPKNLQDFVMQLVSEVYNHNQVILPVTALLALWSAGKAIQALISGLNTIYHIKETRNWFVTRLYAVFYTMLFGLTVIGTFLVLVFGSVVTGVMEIYLPGAGKFAEALTGSRTIIIFAMLFIVFLCMYKILPNRRASFRSQVPGAFFTAMAWSIFSNVFSLYFELFPGATYIYGSMAALIVAMMWLIICMNLTLIGAEINTYFEHSLRYAAEHVQHRLREERMHEQDNNKQNEER